MKASNGGSIILIFVYIKPITNVRNLNNNFKNQELKIRFQIKHNENISTFGLQTLKFHTGDMNSSQEAAPPC